MHQTYLKIHIYQLFIKYVYTFIRNIIKDTYKYIYIYIYIYIL